MFKSKKYPKFTGGTKWGKIKHYSSIAIKEGARRIKHNIQEAEKTQRKTTKRKTNYKLKSEFDMGDWW